MGRENVVAAKRTTSGYTPADWLPIPSLRHLVNKP